jgi:transposase
MDLEQLDPPEWREWRRMRAWHLKQLGWKQREIVTALDVFRAAVCQWMAEARHGVLAPLLSCPAPGHPAKLESAQIRLIPDFLSHRAVAHGFRGGVWTCAHVIEEEFGVTYQKGHVSRLLKQLHWTPQMPITRAIHRDEQEIEQWRVDVWPRLKDEGRRERRALVFVDASCFYLLPGKVRTYAPKAHTPVLREWQTRDHLSVLCGVTPVGKIYTLVRKGSLTGLHTIEFLKQLMRYVGSRLWVIWDGSSIHRRAVVTEFLARATVGDIRVERLPPIPS